MSITKIFQNAGVVLQFVVPTIVGLQDIVPALQNKQYGDAGTKALKIFTLIAIQRYGCMLIKKLVPKQRPDGSDFESFPSGHFMIGTQCLTRSLYRDGFPSNTAILTLIATISLGLGRYLPKKHDVVDLTAGGIIGVGLGVGWNLWLKEQL